MKANMTTQTRPNIEYIFGKNRYNHPIMYTRKKGMIQYTYGYPYSLDGWVELERGETIGGPCLVKFYSALRSKYADELIDNNVK